MVLTLMFQRLLTISAGWVNTNITFDFPLVEGATLPFDGYELLSGVTISFHVLGEATEANPQHLEQS